MKSIEQHLYVLSTLAFALLIQQFTAIEWGTEAQPFPRLIPISSGWFDQQFWLPLLACAATIVGLELLYRRTLVGRAFLAIAEDSYAARALGLPEQRLRLASFALAGIIGALGGFTGGEMLLAFFGNQAILSFLLASCRLLWGWQGQQPPRESRGLPDCSSKPQTIWPPASSAVAVIRVRSSPCCCCAQRGLRALPRRVASDGGHADDHPQ